jgi:hypothetical protein
VADLRNIGAEAQAQGGLHHRGAVPARVHRRAARGPHSTSPDRPGTGSRRDENTKGRHGYGVPAAQPLARRVAETPELAQARTPAPPARGIGALPCTV